MKSMTYGGAIGMICGIVWVFGNFSGVLLVLALTVLGLMVGAVVGKFGGLRNLISQLVSDN
ncbi:MAG: hypothetical protein ABF679_09925 [Lentilactobacillus diolivorans]|jgi:ABC-type microcin C transport system permease subunit YejE|uniref:DUF2273 domain-containing protein n=2 Tax=Lentilactobacillus diolivorans TaxID=179838 RepID=A0A0R1SFA6_9LACO|nr:hypothetical protein [Lentilactobacillus diolivorans]KRL64504.1 hypothetical protein FC85_GL001014 [Lentilactobacillus diolivorans DSM 14421]MDH5106087.1 hypothetical protein [Lentilactobacillus diolivorans]RRG00627.1 MAG: hypothetical protein DUD34_14900 [Lactobacillus sp.]GEP25253.1 hypothetical protein LDI01_28460 [Lentilactobacillus diolivorans]